MPLFCTLSLYLIGLLIYLLYSSKFCEGFSVFGPKCFGPYEHIGIYVYRYMVKYDGCLGIVLIN